MIIILFQGGGVYYMISRTLGPEFGGSVGTLFYFANVVSCALYLAASTEALVNNFGPEGSIIDFIPTGFWWNFAYATILNGFNLLICAIGTKWFGRTTVLILSAVIGCALVTVISFFQDSEMVISFKEPCFELSNKSYIENCTISYNGSFIGILDTNSKKVESLLASNLLPR